MGFFILCYVFVSLFAVFWTDAACGECPHSLGPDLHCSCHPLTVYGDDCAWACPGDAAFNATLLRVHQSQ